jgi:hypothetical protein
MPQREGNSPVIPGMRTMESPAALACDTYSTPVSITPYKVTLLCAKAETLINPAIEIAMRP